MKRRQLLEQSAAVAAASILANPLLASVRTSMSQQRSSAPRLRFGVVGVNHAHINGMIEATVRAGDELVSFHAL